MTAESNQGEGTYDYECRKPGCFYCAGYGLNPKPDIYFEPKAVTIDPIYENAPPRKAKRTYAKRDKPILIEPPKVGIWTPYKLDYLLNNYHRFSTIDLSAKLRISVFYIRIKMAELELRRNAQIRTKHFERESTVLDNNYGGWF